MWLTDNQIELLRQFGQSTCEWFRPMDLGGRDGTSHSSILRALEHKGLVRSRQRGPQILAVRGSKMYQLTEQGHAAVAASAVS